MAIDIKEILANGLLDLCHKKDLSQITVKDLLETTGSIVLMGKIQILISMNHLSNLLNI